jgi:hypothetical protein
MSINIERTQAVVSGKLPASEDSGHSEGSEPIMSTSGCPALSSPKRTSGRIPSQKYAHLISKQQGMNARSTLVHAEAIGVSESCCRRLFE